MCMMASPSQSRLLNNSSNKRNCLQPRPSSFDLKPSGPKARSTKSARQVGTEHKTRVAPTKIFSTGKDKPQKQQYDEEATRKFDAMLDGNLTDLPPLPKSMVRIFLSSTFSDMRQERNILAREVYPKLRDFCSGLGLAFQVVDMRWGVTEDSQNDHSVEKICLLEVKNCQNVSKGPNFVALSGDRYGFRPIPSEIVADEFNKLFTMATQLDLPNKDLLTTWYKLDENSIPSLYLLQPIRSKFTFFGDYSPGCDALRNKDTANWWKTFGMIQEVLRKSASELFKENKMSSERKHSYFSSVTECEIEQGILTARDINSQCLFYQRQFQSLDKSAGEVKDAKRFKEFVTINGITEVDLEVEQLRESLRDNKVRNKLPGKNIRKYSVPWIPGGINPSNVKHKEYLDSFCENFISDCQMLINKTILAEQRLINMSNYYSSYDETIHHLRFCQTKCESFCGQEKILKSAKSYILDESGRRPLIIHAESGVGKTSIMAMIMKSIPDWLNNKPHTKLIRFLGTTPKTYNIYDVLFSILGQLADVFDIILSPICYKNMKNLVDFLPRFLRQVAGKRPVVILLDSVDQIGQQNKAYSMEWLPTLLPQNIKLILSTLPDEQGILDNIKKVLPHDDCYIHVPLLSNTAAQSIANTYLKNSKRRLTEVQMKILLSGFNISPSPLFLKLLLDEAKKWPSYVSNSTLDQLPSTVQEAINKLFETLEKKFGHLLVSHGLGYITVGLGGLTEIEIEDVLSCDDMVLNDLYRYHDPPVPGFVRIPPLIWARIRFDLKEYLVERLSYGKDTLHWYHRQFIQTAKSRYTTDGKDIHLHKNLTDMYLQETGIKRTINLKYRNGLAIQDADRQITPQPFEAKNQRKLACLPYHAMQAYTLIGPDIVKAKIFCNFRFLCTKIAAFSLQETISDLSDFLETNDDEEVTILRNYLCVAKDNLTQPVRLAVCLLTYISPSENHKYLKDLQLQCLQYLHGQKTPLLIPEFPCLAPRQDASSALNTSLQGYSSVLARSENCFLLKARKDKGSNEDKFSEFAIYNTSTDDIQTYDLSDIFEISADNIVRMNGKKVFYITKSGLVSHSLLTNKSTNFVFADKIPRWSPRTCVVSQFYMDTESDVGILVMKSFLIHVSIPDMNFVQQFDCRRKLAEIKNCLVYKTVEGFKILAVGSMSDSTDDQLQGPEISGFITVFESGKETPLKFIQLDKEINTKYLTLCAREEWSVGVLMDTKGIEEKEENRGITPSGSLITFKCVPPFSHTEIPITGNVDKLSGNPNKPQVLSLSQSGCIYLVNVESSEQKLEIMLNYPIKDFDVLWEDQIAFLCFSQGNISMYDLENDRNLGAFSAHSTQIREIFIVDQQAATLGSLDDLKLWSIQLLVEKAKTETEEQKCDTDLLNQMDVISFIVIGLELVTCSDDGYLRIWDFKSYKYLRQHHIEMQVSFILELINDALVLLDETAGKLLVFDIFSGQPVIKTSEFPNKVLAVTTNHAKESLYIISESPKDQVQIDIYNMLLEKTTKSIFVQKGFTYVHLTAILTLSERFLILRAEISDTEYNAVKEMWKKGQFSEQPHKYKFNAIDLSQGNGGLMPCYRRLTKIPVLGVKVCAYTANTVLITTSDRWLVIWDIPTGGCDQKPVKNNKAAGMFYRPGWLGQQCKGTSNSLAISNRQEFVVVGSEDGYVIIYNAETGVPRNSAKPSTCHNADVHMVAISPNSKWVASSCRGSVLKLWDSFNGKEVFSLRLDAAAQQMSFTADSKKLVLCTGSQTTRVIVLSVHEGST